RQVTVSNVDQTANSVVLQLVNGHEQASFSISTLSDGQHAISATYSGGGSYASSIVSGPLLQTVIGTPAGAGPTVKLVQRFGVHLHPTHFVVTFSSGRWPIKA